MTGSIGRHIITFRAKREIAENTDLYSFNMPEDFTFTAGQFATLRIPSIARNYKPADAVRAFSFASAPHEAELAFAWRRSESPFKKTADKLVPGDTVEMIAPAGHAVVPDDRDVIFLVGGIGITPVRSILRHVQHCDEHSNRFTLLYSNRTPKDAPFFSEMHQYDNVCKIVYTMTEADNTWTGETGFIDTAMVQRAIDTYNDQIFYIVGTGGFVEAMRAVVADFGVGNDHIICDNFG